MTKRSLCLGAALSCAFATAVSAQSILNPSFENPVTQSYTEGAPTSFTLNNPGGNTSAGVQTLGTGKLTLGTGDGNQSLYINATGTAGQGVYQDLGQLQTNTTYTLTFAATAGTYQADISTFINAAASFYNATDASGTALATTNVALFAGNHTFSDYTLTYTTGNTASGDLTLLLSNQSTTTGQAAFDNLRLSITTVPEPSTWVMASFLVGLLGLTILRRRSAV